MHTRRNGVVRPALVAALFAATLFVAPCAAQSESYTLNDDGSWTLQSAPDPASDAGVMAEARRLLAQNRAREAKRVLDEWIGANERSGKEHVPEAFRLRGDALVAMRDEYKALYDYETVIKRFPQSEEFVIAVERELDIGVRYAHGMKKKFLGMRIEDAGDLAAEILIRVQERMPGSALAERAAIELGDYYFRRREMRDAADAYDLYLINFPNGPNRMRAMERRIYASIARFRGPRHDASGLIDAQIQIESFALQYPTQAEREGLNSALISRLDESAAAHMLDTAEWYLRTKDDPSAALVLRRLVRKHPQTVAASRAMDILESRGWVETARPAAPAPNEAPEARGAEAGQ